MYAQIRKGAVITFIASIVICTIVAILGIWGVFNNDSIKKSFESLFVLFISGLLIVIATLAREGRLTSGPAVRPMAPGVNQQGQPQSDVNIGKVIVIIIVILFGLPLLLGILSGLSRF